MNKIRKSMKNTHTVQDIEGLMFDYATRIQNARTKTEKTVLLKELKVYEKHYDNIQEKHINGKKYPVKKTPKDISKKELLALIDSVSVEPRIEDDIFPEYELDLSGVSPGSNRFTFRE